MGLISIGRRDLVVEVMSVFETWYLRVELGLSGGV